MGDADEHPAAPESPTANRPRKRAVLGAAGEGDNRVLRVLQRRAQVGSGRDHRRSESADWCALGLLAGT